MAGMYKKRICGPNIAKYVLESRQRSTVQQGVFVYMLHKLYFAFFPHGLVKITPY